MKRRVNVASAAAQGLEDARDYLNQPGSGPVAQKRWLKLLGTTELLAIWPYAGAASADHLGFRFLVVEGYYFVYRVSPDTGDSSTAGDVTVVAVFPPRVGRREI